MLLIVSSLIFLQHMRCGTYIFHFIFILFNIICSLHMLIWCWFIQKTGNCSILSLSVRNHTHTCIHTQTQRERESQPCFALLCRTILPYSAQQHTQTHTHTHQQQQQQQREQRQHQTDANSAQQENNCVCVCVQVTVCVC